MAEIPVQLSKGAAIKKLKRMHADAEKQRFSYSQVLQDNLSHMRFFKTPCYPQRYDLSEIFAVAREHEVRYPMEMLAFYQSSTGNLNVTATRKEYAAKGR